MIFYISISKGAYALHYKTANGQTDALLFNDMVEADEALQAFKHFVQAAQ